MKNFFLAALACLTVVVTQNELQAQITWSPSVQMFATGDNTDFISQNGTFVLGVAPGGVDPGTGVVATVGTSDFLIADQLPGTITNVTSTQNGVTLDSAFTRVQAPTFLAGEFTDAGVLALIQPAAWNHDHVPGTPTVTLSGLIPNDTYEIQILVNDARDGRNINWQIGFTNGSGDGLVAGVAKMSNRDPADTVLLNSAGDYIIGTFVADASGTQTFEMNATRGASVSATPSAPQDQFIIGQTIDIASNTPPGADRAGTNQFNALQLRNISNVMPTVCGDVNLDGSVSFLDIQPFIAILSSGGFQAEADCDNNGAVNFLDIQGFIAALSGP